MKSLGQYFTTNQFLLESLFGLIKNKPKRILEPSCGRGDIVKYVKDRQEDIKFTCYEIDKTIQPIVDVKIIYHDFLTIKSKKKYETIIGNPPYIKKGNVCGKFLDKCFDMLTDNGEMIMIVPSDTFKLTSNKHLLNKMLANGNITHIITTKNDNMFDGAKINVIIFRYERNIHLNVKCNVDGNEKNIINENGILTFGTEGCALGDMFRVFVGIVSGCETVFKNESGNVSVRTDIDKIEKYILLDNLDGKDAACISILKENKEKLMKRRIKKMTDDNWYQWGALRNINKMREHAGEDCIYVRNITRKDVKAGIGKVELFGGKLLCMLPKKPMEIEKMRSIVNCINSEEFCSNYTYSGRFKIGQRQLANSQLML